MVRSLSVRRLVTVVAAAALTTAGIAATTTSASEALVKQPLGFSAKVVGDIAYVDSTVVVGFTVTNTGTKKNEKLENFTLVVPPGVSSLATGQVNLTTIKSAGVSGPGNWVETILPCGTTPNCSSLVKVSAGVPREKSGIRPGESVTASISFVTPKDPGQLSFALARVDDDYALPAPVVIDVVPGDPALYGLSWDTTAAFKAGSTHKLTIVAEDKNGNPVASAPADIKVTFGTDDSGGVVTPVGTNVTAVSPDTADLRPSFFAHLAGGSSTTKFEVQVYLQTATDGNSAVVAQQVAKPDVNGSAFYSVGPDVPSTVTVDSIVDNNTVPLPNPAANQPFTVSFHVADRFGNVVTTGAGDVAVTAGGPGTLTAGTSTGSDPKTLGTVVATYSTFAKAVPFTATLSQLTVPGSNPVVTNPVSPPISGSKTSDIDAAGVSTTLTGTAVTLTVPCDPTTTTCPTVNVPANGTGTISLSSQQCDPADTTGACANGGLGKPIVAAVQGTFGGLTPTDPGVLTLVCPLVDCPHGAVTIPPSRTITGTLDDDKQLDTVSPLLRRNLLHPELAYDGDSDPAAPAETQADEDAEDALAYPAFGQSTAVGAPATWAQLPACGATPADWPVIPGTTTLEPYCVKSSTRVASLTDFIRTAALGDDDVPITVTFGPTYGQLVVTVNFLTDPKVHI
jgi:hypothetical protein